MLIKFPEDLLHIILEYDGRIKYKHGKYVNIIHKYDERYNIIAPIISKKIEIMKTIEFYRSGFYFELWFDAFDSVGLAYDYNFSCINKFEICYYDLRDHIVQFRTYL